MRPDSHLSCYMQKLANVDNRKLEASIVRAYSTSPTRPDSPYSRMPMRPGDGPVPAGDIVRNLKDKNKALVKVRHPLRHRSPYKLGSGCSEGHPSFTRTLHVFMPRQTPDCPSNVHKFSEGTHIHAQS
jgi:hypothetical protein